MQNTRLTTIVEIIIGRVAKVFQTPWQRTSLLLISLLFGFFLGNAVSTTAGQRAELDIFAAFVLVMLTEFISRLTYGRRDRLNRSWPIEVANMLKLGLIYSLFLDAFKLGS